MPVVQAPQRTKADWTADTLYNQGTALYNAGRMEEAEAHFRRALRHQPRHSSSYSGIALIFHHVRRDSVRAEQYYNQAVALDRDNAVAWFGLGNLRFGEARYEAAVSNYDAALRADSAYADAYFNRGLALYRLQRSGEAESSYSRGLAWDSLNGQAYAMRGLIRCQTGGRGAGCIDLAKASSMGVTGVAAEIERYCR